MFVRRSGWPSRIAPGQLTESGLQGECIARSDVGIAVDWTLLRPTASSERSLVLELFAKLLPGIVYEEDQVRLYLILGENVPPNPTLSEGQLQIVAGEFIPGPGREVYCDIERRPMEAKNLLEMFNTAGQEPVFGSLEAQILDLLTLVYVPRIVRVESEDECEYEVISATLVPQSVFEGSQPDENLDTASPLPLGGLDSLPVPPSLLGTRQLTLSETRSRLEDLLAGQWIPRVQSRQRCEDGTIADAYSGEQVTTLPELHCGRARSRCCMVSALLPEYESGSRLRSVLDGCCNSYDANCFRGQYESTKITVTACSGRRSTRDADWH